MGAFDLVFIDADKEPYPDYYEAAMELLSERGIIAVDNVLLNGRVLNPESRSGAEDGCLQRARRLGPAGQAGDAPRPRRRHADSQGLT